MKTEIRTKNEGTLYSQDAQLVSIDLDHLTTISITASGIEIETYNNDGDRTSQTWTDMPVFLNRNAHKPSTRRESAQEAKCIN